MGLFYENLSQKHVKDQFYNNKGFIINKIETDLPRDVTGCTINLSEELRKHRDLFEENPNQNVFLSDNLSKPRDSKRNSATFTVAGSRNTLDKYSSEPNFQERQYLNELIGQGEGNYDFCADHLANICQNEVMVEKMNVNYTIKEEAGSERYKTDGDFDTERSYDPPTINKNYSDSLNKKSVEGK